MPLAIGWISKRRNISSRSPQSYSIGVKAKIKIIVSRSDDPVVFTPTEPGKGDHGVTCLMEEGIKVIPGPHQVILSIKAYNWVSFQCEGK